MRYNIGDLQKSCLTLNLIFDFLHDVDQLRNVLDVPVPLIQRLRDPVKIKRFVLNTILYPLICNFR